MAPPSRAEIDERLNFAVAIAREAGDQQLQVAGAWVEEDAPICARLKALPRLIKFYGAWFLGIMFRNSVRPDGGIPEGC